MHGMRVQGTDLWLNRNTNCLTKILGCYQVSGRLHGEGKSSFNFLTQNQQYSSRSSSTESSKQTEHEEGTTETYFGFETAKFDLSELALKPLIRNKNTHETRHLLVS